MQEINQNFPSVVSSLSRMKVNYFSVSIFSVLSDIYLDLIVWYAFKFMQLNESIKEEIVTNQRMIPPGKSLMALNGALVDTEDIDLYM